MVNICPDVVNRHVTLKMSRYLRPTVQDRLGTTIMILNRFIYVTNDK